MDEKITTLHIATPSDAPSKNGKSRSIKLDVNNKDTSISSHLRRYFNFKRVNEDFLLKYFCNTYGDTSYCDAFLDALKEDTIPQWAVQEFYNYFYIDENFIKNKYLNPAYKRMFETKEGKD